jgi:hypothetical protein
MGRIARALIDAALANEDIQAYIADPSEPKLWTVQSVTRNPTVRLEWEHASIFAGIGDGMAAARHKNFGEFLGVMPLLPTDPVHFCRVLFAYKSSSPYNQRIEQRRAMKRILGRSARKLVTRAYGDTKRAFLAGLSPADALTITRRLGIDPGRFWRAANGFEMLPNLPKQAVQLTLI